jgi:hypothetical protein
MNRELSKIIGTDPYYTKISSATLKIKSQDGGDDIEGQAYTYEITKAADSTQVGKYGLTTTYEKDGKSNTDTYIGTQGEVLVLLRNLKDQSNTTTPATPATVKTKSYSDATPLTQQGNKPVDVTAADKEWKAAGGNTVTQGTTSINKWDALGEETNEKAKPELSASNLTELSDKTKVLGNVDDNIELTFNETVANPDGIELWDANANTKIAATVTLGNDSQTPTVENNKVIIDPSSPLTAGGKYEVRNSGGTKLADLAVNPNAVSDPVVNFSVGGTPAAAGSVPAVSSTDLGSIDATQADAKVDITFGKNIAAVDTTNGNIIVNNGSSDVTLTSSQYEIAGTKLTIKKDGLTALGITDNSSTDRTLNLKDGQIADATDANQKNAATNLTFKTEAPAAALDANPTANIKTLPDSEFPQSGPIELTFENNLQVADNPKLDATRIVVMEADDSGNQISGTEQNGLTYEVVDGNKLKISQPSGSQFKPATKYKILIQPGTFLNDDGKKANADFIPYTFKAVTPVVKKK